MCQGMRSLIIALSGVVFLTSCVKDIQLVSDGVGAGADHVCEVTVGLEDQQLIGTTKSSFTHEDVSRITDLNVFIYHEGCLLEKYSRYYTDLSSVKLTLPYDKDGFNIYMVGNVGRIDAPEDEADVCRLRHVIGSYDEFRVKGVPVANVFPDHIKGSLAHFRLRRLVGQYDVSMKTSASTAEYYVKDVRLLNCALDVFPFSSDSKATVFAGSAVYGQAAGGDVLTSEDIAKLNAGETVSLYFVENMQGELLPGNTDRRKKIPSILDNIDKGLAGKCTYLEVTADITTSAAEYTDGKYRFYLGQNETTDFSIRRNTLYDVTLDFTQNMVYEQEWRIEVGEPEVKPLLMSKDKAHVVRGADDYILISGPRMTVSQDTEFESDWDECEYGLTDVTVDGAKCQKLTFSTGKEITGKYDWGTDYELRAKRYDIVLESVEKYNGEPLVKKTVPVYVHERIFPLFIRMGSNGSAAPYQVEAVTDAPIDYGFELSAAASVSVVSSGSTTTGSYSTSASSMSTSSGGLSCCAARFTGLYNSLGTSSGKQVLFKRLDVSVAGRQKTEEDPKEFYMGDGGQAYWGPGTGQYPAKFSNLVENDDLTFTYAHFCDVSGCISYQIKGGGRTLFLMTPKAVSCATTRTTGTSNSLIYDINDYNIGDYAPFYIANGDLEYSAPVEFVNDSPAYLDNSGRKSIIYQMYGPGRDVFYPNGVGWGTSQGSPSLVHKFGYTAGLMQQFFGNVHTWQIYKGYECDFYMTVNGCTAWPWSSNLSTGFSLAYDL